MNFWSKLVEAITNSAELLAFVSSLFAVLMSGFLSALAKNRLSKSATQRVTGEMTRTSSGEPSELIPSDRPRDIHVIMGARFAELRDLLRKQERAARAYGYASSILTFGQFIIGGLLTTSFLQHSLSEVLVGLFGLLVLGSSLLRQHYRPDVQAAAAEERVVRLKALIREAENQLSLTGEGANDAISGREILQMLTQGLAEIEQSQLRDFQSSTKSINAPKSSRKARTLENRRQ